MFYKNLLFGFILFGNLLNIFKIIIEDVQQQKPLPEEGKEIYPEERYRQFLHYEHDYHPVYAIEKILSLFSDVLIIYLPFFSFIERICKGNVYLIGICTAVMISFLNAFLSLPIEYYSTFVIEEKYGLNKKNEERIF